MKNDADMDEKVNVAIAVAFFGMSLYVEYSFTPIDSLPF